MNLFGRNHGNQFYIVDLSYIIFFSGYSAFTTYKRNFDIQNSSLHPKFDPTLDEEFCEIFQTATSRPYSYRNKIWLESEWHRLNVVRHDQHRHSLSQEALSPSSWGQRIWL